MSTKKRFKSRGFTNYKSKRAQVTVFMIVGIILIFTFIAIFFVTQETVKDDFDMEGDPVILSVPTSFKPIQAYTESCLSRVAERGLRILGEQGGYIYPDLVGEYSSQDPSNSDGISLGGAKVPFWLYNIEDNRVNKIQFASLRPELLAQNDPKMSIEAQLGRYVDERIEECLQNFEIFHNQGFLVSHEVPSTKVKLTDTTVNFLLDMRVTVSNVDTDTEFTKTLVKIHLPLKRYYLAAEEITKLQKNVSYLEQQAMELIQIFSAKDINKLPPTSATGFDLVPTIFWNSVDVRKDLKSILTSYVPMVRFVDSSDFVRYNYPLSNLQALYQKNYDNMALPLKEAKGLDVNFDYLGWNPYIKVNEKDGKIKPQHMAQHSLGVHSGFQWYTTVYDLSYPVLVTIRDEAALDGEGYNFVFALESNIRKNAPAEDGMDVLPPRSLLSDSMLCDEDKLDTKPLRTLVVDSYSKEPLEFVKIGFKVPKTDTCDIGQTDEDGLLTAKYPAVYGGIINFIKEDYLMNNYAIDTYKFKEQSGIVGYSLSNFDPSIIIPLHKEVSIEVGAIKRSIDKCINQKCFFSGPFGVGGIPAFSVVPENTDAKHEWFYTGIISQMEEFDEAIITFSRKADLYPGSVNEEYTTVVTLKGNKTDNVTLYPGIYEVTGLLISKEPIRIPEETRCDGSCFTIEENVMDEFISGQIKWDTEDNYITITPEQLNGASKLILQIPYINIDAVPEEAGVRVIEDMQVVGEVPKISQAQRIKLEPLYT